MRLLPRGGYLATCSCSHFMDSANFEYMLKKLAKDANVKLREVEVRSRPPTIPSSGTCLKPPTSSSISSRLSRLLCNAHKKGIGKFCFHLKAPKVKNSSCIFIHSGIYLAHIKRNANECLEASL